MDNFESRHLHHLYRAPTLNTLDTSMRSIVSSDEHTRCNIPKAFFTLDIWPRLAQEEVMYCGRGVWVSYELRYEQVMFSDRPQV